MSGPPWKILQIVSKGDYNYAVVPDHPHATKNGYVLEHRVVMENKLGRILSRNELVHHKKHAEKKNNDESNLEVKARGQYEREHGLARGRRMVELLCPSCSRRFIRQRCDTFLVRKGGRYTCCSTSCRSKFNREIQLYGNTPSALKRIRKNVVRKYRTFSRR